MPPPEHPVYGKVTQVFPGKKQVPLEGLYLAQGLAGLSARIARPLVIADYLTDRNGVIAKKNAQDHLQVPPEIKNPSDWRLFQELMAQADVIIGGADYLKRVLAQGDRAQDILFQFEPGRAFEKLGQWRLAAGFKKRSPDLAIIARSLDFEFPEGVLGSGRRVIIFTTDVLANSARAAALTASGAFVHGSGEAGVDGNRMIDYLGHGLGYHVIMMATGPSVLELLLEANRLDLLYITEAQVEIPFADLADVQTILPEGKKEDALKEFGLTHQYLQENGTAENGSFISQVFRRYDRKGVLVDRPLDAS